MTSGYYCAIFPFCGGGKKKDDKKTKEFYDWATTGIPVKMISNDLNYQFFVTVKSLEEPRGTCMKEVRPRLFRVAKKVWNEWTESSQ